MVSLIQSLQPRGGTMKKFLLALSIIVWLVEAISTSQNFLSRGVYVRSRNTVVSRVVGFQRFARCEFDILDNDWVCGWPEIRFPVETSQYTRSTLKLVTALEDGYLFGGLLIIFFLALFLITD